jgi:hypothetical protein
MQKERRMSEIPETRVVSVAKGLESTSEGVALRDQRHEALAVLIGKWINEGNTIASEGVPAMPILTSDVYEWAPGGFFVIHSAYGRIGDTSVGGLEVIGVDGDAYVSTFYDSFGNVHISKLIVDGNVMRWIGRRTRCIAEFTDGGTIQRAHHESSPDGIAWRPSMDVTLRKTD